MSQKVRTRFAPSPTGMLHIGGARTALFNYLYAKHMGGEYLIRIEDTDTKRSTEEAKNVIKEGLAWLGLGPTDGNWVLQSESVERHKADVQKLLDTGKAYACFATKEELDALREKQRVNKQTPLYDARHRNLTEEQIDAFKAEGRTFVVRIKMPEDGVTAWDDLVQGRIEISNHTLDDFIIMRSDGTPTYNLVVALDDHDMEISHVIRGDDHINNTPKQIAIYNALGLPVPQFAHIPMIHGKNGKMSKRDGATNVLEYRTLGYLPEAVNNYLMRLGWSLGDQEQISMAEAIQHFDINGVNKGASVFDTQKLDWLNGEYIKNMEDNAALTALLKPYFEAANIQTSEAGLSYLSSGGLNDLKPRAKKLTDLAEAVAFYFNEPPFNLDEKAASQLNDEAVAVLTKLATHFEGESNWNHEGLLASINTFCEKEALKFKHVGMPLRVALTGTTKAPSVTSIMEVFGKAESLRRIGHATVAK